MCVYVYVGGTGVSVWVCRCALSPYGMSLMMYGRCQYHSVLNVSSDGDALLAV